MTVNRAVPLWLLWSGIRRDDGTLLAGGTVIAYQKLARNQKGHFIYRRADIWADADKTTPIFQSKVTLDAQGIAVDSGGATLPVYGDGSYRILLFDAGATLPTPKEEDDHQQLDPANAGTLPPGTTPPIRDTDVFYTSHEVVNVTHFGAKGTADFDNPDVNAADDTDALQAAIDYCLNSDEQTPLDTFQRTRMLYIPKGIYRITRPLLIRKRYPDSIDKSILHGTYASVHIYGEKRGSFDKNADSMIYAEFHDAPAIIVQSGLGVILRNLCVVGVNRFDASFANWYAPGGAFANDKGGQQGLLLDDNTFFYNWATHIWLDPLKKPPALNGIPRDKLQSPYAGICIDPFVDPTAAKTKYPGFDAEYAVLDYPGSSEIVIEGCAITRFIVDIMICPVGSLRNAENITVRETRLETSKVAIAISQSQTRGVNLVNCVITLCQAGIDNRTYGAGTPGTAPNVRGLVAALARWLFNLDMQTSALTFTGIHAEAFASIGQVPAPFGVGQNMLTFEGCDFDFYASRPQTETHLLNFGPVRFVGCSFNAFGNPPPESSERELPVLMFCNYGPLAFESCAIRTGPDNYDATAKDRWNSHPVAMGFHDPHNVRFDRVVHIDALGAFDPSVGKQGPVSAQLTSYYPSLPGTTTDPWPAIRRVQMPPGATIPPYTEPTPTQPPAPAPTPATARVIASAATEFTVGTLALTAGSRSDEARFTAPVGMLLPGDIVHAQPANTPPPSWDVVVYKGAGANPSDEAPKNPDPYALISQAYAYANKGPIGVVVSYSQVLGLATIRNVPGRFVKGYVGSGITVPLTVRRFPRYHPQTRGDVAQNGQTTTITNVLVDGGATRPSTVWRPYDRIQAAPHASGATLLPGTYILAITDAQIFGLWVGTFLISRAATRALTGVRLFDAEVFQLAVTAQ